MFPKGGAWCPSPSPDRVNAIKQTISNLVNSSQTIINNIDIHDTKLKMLKSCSVLYFKISRHLNSSPVPLNFTYTISIHK